MATIGQNPPPAHSPHAGKVLHVKFSGPARGHLRKGAGHSKFHGVLDAKTEEARAHQIVAAADPRHSHGSERVLGTAADVSQAQRVDRHGRELAREMLHRMAVLLATPGNDRSA